MDFQRGKIFASHIKIKSCFKFCNLRGSLLLLNEVFCRRSEKKTSSLYVFTTTTKEYTQLLSYFPFKAGLIYNIIFIETFFFATLKIL